MRNPDGNVSAPINWDVRVGPVVLSITPGAVSAGTAITIQLIGMGFVPGSTVYFGTTQLATTYGSPTQLSAVIPASVTAGTTQSYTAQLMCAWGCRSV